VTARRLRAHGITRLVDVRTADPTALRAAVGSLAEWLQRLASGLDDRPVVSEHAPKSSGSERTFARDLTALDEIHREVEEMARAAAAWLARRDLYARTVTLKMRYADFTTITRSHSDRPTRDETALVRRALAQVARTQAGRRPVRLLGVSVHALATTEDPSSASRDGELPFDL
jgi:DNA polymerase IV